MILAVLNTDTIGFTVVPVVFHYDSVILSADKVLLGIVLVFESANTASLIMLPIVFVMIFFC